MGRCTLTIMAQYQKVMTFLPEPFVQTDDSYGRTSISSTLTNVPARHDCGCPYPSPVSSTGFRDYVRNASHVSSRNQAGFETACANRLNIGIHTLGLLLPGTIYPKTSQTFSLCK